MTTAVRSALMTPRGARLAPGEAASIAFWGRVLVVVIALAWLMTLVVDFRVALTLLLVIAFGVAAIGMRYPRLGLLGVGMLCTLNDLAAPLLLTGGVWRWNTVSYWLLLVTLLFWHYVLSVGRLQNRILLAFVLLLGLEILVSPDPQDGMQQVFAVVAVFGLLVYVRRAAFDQETWYWLGVVTGVSGAGGGAAFLLQQGTLPHVGHNVWPFLMLTAMLAICLAFVVTASDPRRRFVLALLALVNGIWVYLSGARGNLLIAVVCLAFVVTMMKLRRAFLFAIVAALVSGLLMSQFTTLHERTVARFRLFTDASQSLSVRTSGRADLALGAWYIFKEHPLGVGTGGFPSARADLGPREGLSGWRRGRPFSAMSGWGKVLAENGVPGILLLGTYVLSFTVKGWRARNPDLLKLGMLVSAVLAIGWISNEFQNKALWFVAAGAMVLLERNSILGPELHANSIARR